MKRELIMRLEKWACWLGVMIVLYLLRHLFPALFLTFILSYMGSTAVRLMTRRFPHRRTNLVVFYAVLIAILSGVGTMIVPRIVIEASDLARQIITREAADDVEVDAGNGNPEDLTDEQTRSVIGREITQLIDTQIVRLVGDETFESFTRSDTYSSMVSQIEKSVGQIGPLVARGGRQFVNGIFGFGFQFMLSLILSFLVIWDLPRIKAGIARLADSNVADAYAEIAPGMRAFGSVLGRAFEAQTIVAAVNTFLSCIAFSILGVPSIALLGTIVFFCSYIPVVGMIMSTLPAAILGYKFGGFAVVLWIILAVTIIHVVEAYALNPLIYGAHLKMHPLAVIIVLLVAEHVFGVWGLLLGVPVAAFVLKFVIGGAEFEELRPEPA